MAVTHGHGNPNWTRDETILAFDLYSSVGVPGKNDRRIKALSESLRNLPFNEKFVANDTFRNVDGVRFKLQNLHAVLTGRGLTHVSAMDRAIVAEFRNDSASLADHAKRIISEAKVLEIGDFSESEDEATFYEGRVLYAAHKKRERSPSLRKKKIKSRRAKGLSCDLCSAKWSHMPAALEEAHFEVHHINPLASSETKRSVRLSDVALLCACCHRVIHKLISAQGRWLKIAEAHDLLENAK